MERVNNLFKVTRPISLIWAKFAWSRSCNFCLRMTFCALIMNKLISGCHCPHSRRAGPSTLDTPLLVPPLAPFHQGSWLLCRLLPRYHCVWWEDKDNYTLPFRVILRIKRWRQWRAFHRTGHHDKLGANGSFKHNQSYYWFTVFSTIYTSISTSFL